MIVTTAITSERMSMTQTPCTNLSLAPPFLAQESESEKEEALAAKAMPLPEIGEIPAVLEPDSILIDIGDKCWRDMNM